MQLLLLLGYLASSNERNWRSTWSRCIVVQMGWSGQMVAFIDQFLCEMECGKCIKHCIIYSYLSSIHGRKKRWRRLKDCTKKMTLHAITTRLPRLKKLTDCIQVMIQLHQSLVKRRSSLQEGVLWLTLA